MKMKLTLTSTITYILNKYVSLVLKTSNISFIENSYNNDNNYNNSILTFWHGESFCNYLLLRQMKERGLNVNIVVTKDKRGDYISGICNTYGIDTIRAADGLKIKDSINYIKYIASKDDTSLAVSLDGPLGPIHQPKKLAFMLSNHSNKDFVKADCDIKKKIILNRRWDRYIIPLPFNDIIFNINKIESISTTDLSNFKSYKNNFNSIYN